ncbi:MAG: type II CRISPR RNA-guided endonuclease Cas9 [Sphingosinicella sp.]|uniref:type II CRISPR RNA-guided endonuclease Cas9 n=1 Tax=Sphingosinicella sp. TaxID=1917971 RepID=UPI0040382CF2
MRRLGLDIGSNSIGWCLIEDDRRIVDIGVRVFADGRDPQSGSSLAANRHEARVTRRRRDRYLGRRSAVLKTLVAHGLMPADPGEAKQVAEHDPYELRARALQERLEPFEIGRALFHLNQRRGFRSSRRIDRPSNPGNEGKIADGAIALDHAMAEERADTLGQFLATRQTKRVRMSGDNQEYDFFPQRRHVEYEFARIWEEQAKHHPALLTEAARTALHRILFFQRPWKKQEVGYCTFAGMNGVPAHEHRLAKAHPLFQRRRLYEEVNQLRIVGADASDRALTLAERDALIAKLQSRKRLGYEALGKAIMLAEGERFDQPSERARGLLGDEVRAVLAARKRFGRRWQHFSDDEQWHIVERLQNEEDTDILLAWLKDEYGLDEAAAEAVANVPLPEGYGRFGETASLKLLDALKAGVVSYGEAAEAAGFRPGEQSGRCFDYLPYYGEILAREIPPGRAEYGDPLERRYGKITNPTLHIALRQLQKLVNAVIRVHGKPDGIVVELARELKFNEKERTQYERRIRREREAAIARGRQLRSEGFADAGANRMRLCLWEELNPANPLDRRCPYCAAPIGWRQLFTGEADIDLIIPFSKSLDDSISNKVVAHSACIRLKRSQSPWERWGHEESRWETISAQGARLPRAKQWRFGPDAVGRVEREGGVLARHLVDPRYPSRVVGTYLRALYSPGEKDRVTVIPGRMKAKLRRLWGLNSLLPDHAFVENEHSNAPENRLDHRHHAIDATLVALSTPALMQRIADIAARAEHKGSDRLFEDVETPWPRFREELGEKLAGIIVSHKPDHGRKGRPPKHRDTTAGRLHNDTAYGLTGALAPDGKTPIVVHRIPFMSVKPDDLVDPIRIPNEALRRALIEATYARTGREFIQALALFAREHPTFKGIRRIRVRRALTVIPIRDKQGRVYKSYAGSSNARYNVWRLPDGSWVHQVVSTFDAHQKDHQDARPHPAAKKILSLRQNDLIALECEEGLQIMRVIKFSGNGQIAFVEHNEGGKLIQRHKNPEDSLTVINPTAAGLRRMGARQVRVDLLGRVFDPGPRDMAV